MEQINFADVLQKSFIAMSMGSTDRVTLINILVNELVAFMTGLFVFYIYKKTYQGVLYQRSFNIALVVACCVTCLIIMAISGNLILSLGMVGALSIVRFRTPVKDSMDLIFLFWAIAVGICCGVGYFNIAIVGSILIASFILLLTRQKGGEEEAFLMVLQYESPENEDKILEIVRNHVMKMSVKSKSVMAGSTDLTLEVRLKDSRGQFVSELNAVEGVNRVTLIAYDQNYAEI